MTPQQRVERLQGLLARVRSNARKMRAEAPTLPLPVEAAPAGGDAEPIPLRSLARPAQAPPNPPALTGEPDFVDEVSEVRTTPSVGREPSEEVTIAAIEAVAEPITPEELSEEDLVDISDVQPEPSPAAAAATSAAVRDDLDFVDDEEEPPASSRRSRVASSMDEALAAAAESAGDSSEHEVPIKTPPPESGPQEAVLPMPAGLASPAAPDVDELLGQELELPQAAPAPVGPTQEQLGQTIDLEESRGPALELDERRTEVEGAATPHEELEMPLPEREALGGYDARLEPPPEAREELEAHRRRVAEQLTPPAPAASPSFFSEPPAASQQSRTAAAAASHPELTARPVPAASAPERFVSAREAFRPLSFVELLDASLALGRSD